MYANLVLVGKQSFLLGCTEYSLAARSMDTIPMTTLVLLSITQGKNRQYIRHTNQWARSILTEVIIRIMDCGGGSEVEQRENESDRTELSNLMH